MCKYNCYDLFAALVAEANEVDGEEIVLAGKKKAGKSDEEKEAEKVFWPYTATYTKYIKFPDVVRGI